jgi:transcriptional regulator with XRE-family HTH domain
MAWRHDRLRTVRQDRDMTIEVLAGLAGVGARMLARYEAGENEPTANVIVRLSQALGTSADYLLGLSDSKGSGYVEKDLSPDEQDIIEALRARQPAKLLRYATAMLESRG